MVAENRPQHQSAEKTSSIVEHAGTERLGLDRLIFFSDAVFAIAITLLALDIRLPIVLGDVSNAELWQMLGSLLPDYVAFVTSFVVIGLFWLGHHTKFRSIVRYDRPMLSLNMLLLMTIAFMPFPTSVMSDYDNSTATIFYAATVAVAGILSAAISFYAVHNNRLVDHDAPMIHHVKRPWRLIGVPLVFLLSIPIALYNPSLARISWLLMIPFSRL